jgi:hypothetical protein
MHMVLVWVGRIAGIAGVLLCVVALGARATNTWHVGGYAVGALLQAGLAGMLLACLAYVAHLAERPRG